VDKAGQVLEGDNYKTKIISADELLIDLTTISLEIF